MTSKCTSKVLILFFQPQISLGFGFPCFLCGWSMALQWHIMDQLLEKINGKTLHRNEKRTSEFKWSQKRFSRWNGYVVECYVNMRVKTRIFAQYAVIWQALVLAEHLQCLTQKCLVRYMTCSSRWFMRCNKNSTWLFVCVFFSVVLLYRFFFIWFFFHFIILHYHCCFCNVVHFCHCVLRFRLVLIKWVESRMAWMPLASWLRSPFLAAMSNEQ